MQGIDEPDRRGRTGLDRLGYDLDGNPNVVVTNVTLLSSHWYVLRTTEFEYRHSDGHWSTEHRETHDRGDGATMLLYDLHARRVALVRQFRYPVYVNEHPDGMLLETPGGLLDEDDAATAVRREVAEETGLEIGRAEPVFTVYMSPGSVTEKIHFFAAPYVSRAGATNAGATDAGATDAGPTDAGTPAFAGLAEEGEDTEIVEIAFDDALARIGVDIVDAKTIMLLQWAALRGPFAG